MKAGEVLQMPPREYPDGPQEKLDAGTEYILRSPVEYSYSYQYSFLHHRLGNHHGLCQVLPTASSFRQGEQED